MPTSKSDKQKIVEAVATLSSFCTDPSLSGIEIYEAANAMLVYFDYAKDDPILVSARNFVLQRILTAATSGGYLQIHSEVFWNPGYIEKDRETAKDDAE